MRNSDTRVQFTKQALKGALLKIMKKKNINRISVKEICETAGINRGTFYLHYSTPNDLLQEIEDEFMKDCFTYFSSYMKDSSETTNLQAVFKYVTDNIETCRIVMGPNGDSRLISDISNAMKSTIIYQWQIDTPSASKEDLEYIYDYVFNGSISLIMNWLSQREDERIPVEKLGNRLDRLGHYAQEAIKEFI